MATRMREVVEWLSPTEFLARNRERFGRNSLYNWLAEGKLPHVQINLKRDTKGCDGALDLLTAGYSAEGFLALNA